VGTNGWGSATAVALGLILAIGAVVTLFLRRGRPARYLAVTAYVLLFPVHLWFWQFELTGRTPNGTISGYYIWENSVIQILLLGIVPLVVSCFYQFRPVLTAFFLVYLFSLVLQLFSYIYWAAGTTKNFNTSLTHFDSFYFALGTLTTAGSGTISVTSETARHIQALQMTLDLLLIGFAVALILSRYTTLFSKPRPPFPWPWYVEPTPPPPRADRVTRKMSAGRRRGYLRAPYTPGQRYRQSRDVRRARVRDPDGGLRGSRRLPR